MTSLANGRAWTRPRSDPAALSAEILVGAQGMASVEAEWLALFDRVDGTAWSCHPAVYRVWSGLFRRPGSTRLLVVRDAGGRLRGLMPLMLDRVWRGPSATPRFDYDPRDGGMVTARRRRPLPVRQVTTMASLPATMLWVGPLCEPQDAAPVVQAMAAALRRLRGWDVLVLPADEGEDRDRWVGAFAELGATPRVQSLGRRVQNLRHVAPFAEIVGRQAWKFRQNVRRARTAAEAAALRFEIVAGAEAVAPHLPTVAALARASWKHEGRDGTEVRIPYEGDQQSFVERLFGEGRPGVEPALGIVSDPEGPVAVLLLLRHGATVTALLTFWNGRHKSASPGLLLMGQAIDWACAAGARHFDLNATAPWVRYIVDGGRTICHVVVFGRGPWGRALAALARWSGRLA